VAGAGRYGGAAFAGTRYVAAGTLRNQGVYVRRNFGNYNAFNRGWYTRHPGAWFAAGWAAGYAWRAATWPSCLTFVGYPVSTAPVYYDYGNNVTYQGGNVYYNDEVYRTEAEYAQEAAAIADTGRQAQPVQDDQWQPLGVFALTKGDETVSNDIFQLAINKDGVVRGNYYNALTDAVLPVYGSLRKTTQRIAWTIGDNKERVYETGLYNLTKEETPVLVHFGNDRTEQYTLFRIEQKEDQPAPKG
jgi:hypothetical protein